VLTAASIAHSLLTGHYVPADAEQPGADGEGRAAAAQPPAPASSPSAVHLPGQPEHATLSTTGRTYWQSIAPVGVQVAEALADAHSKGVLHRDVKPSNLLLDTQAKVWITDFGLAKAMDSSDNLTHTGDVVGTIRYMAPERFQGEGDARSDLHAL